MGTVGQTRNGLIDVGVAAAPVAGERECGDHHAVVVWPTGVLVAVADGLGHGPEAALASRTACDALVSTAPPEPLTALVTRCHTALQRTRGAAMSMAFFSATEARMEWLAVGNVEGILYRAADRGRTREAIVQRPGIVGRSLPPLRTAEAKLEAGDSLVLATDGIALGFTDRLMAGAGFPPNPADALARFATGTDDALVLVASYRGLAS
jgi:negative regulator of sigma-B (phosphoserine phosphatase)